MSRISKDLKSVFDQAEKAGWTVEQTKNSHFALRPPSGSPYPLIFVGGTISDWRGLKNIVAMLRKCNVEIDRKGR